MSNFSALIATIQANIKTNGQEEITGAILQDVLEAMVQALGTEAINNLETALSNEVGNRQNADGTLQNNIDAEALRAGTAEGGLQTAINGIKSNIDNGFVYAGIATPSGTPASGKVFYLALTAGTYTNFGGLVVTQGINILKYNGSAWSQEQLIAIDDEPTAGSPNLVKSGGVQNELALGAVYDVSAKNPTAGPNNDGKFESLSELLSDANLNTLIPTAVRKGGMSIKFVQSSDNNYVQYRLMATFFSTDEDDWQGVDDVPTAGSNNLVKSGSVQQISEKINIPERERLLLTDCIVINGFVRKTDGTIVYRSNYRIYTFSVEQYNCFFAELSAENDSYAISFVDGNGNYIADSGIVGQTPLNTRGLSFYKADYIPSNAKFVRFSTYKDMDSKIWGERNGMELKDVLETLNLSTSFLSTDDYYSSANQYIRYSTLEQFSSGGTITYFYENDGYKKVVADIMCKTYNSLAIGFKDYKGDFITTQKYEGLIGRNTYVVDVPDDAKLIVVSNIEKDNDFHVWIFKNVPKEINKIDTVFSNAVQKNRFENYDVLKGFIRKAGYENAGKLTPSGGARTLVYKNQGIKTIDVWATFPGTEGVAASFNVISLYTVDGWLSGQGYMSSDSVSAIYGSVRKHYKVNVPANCGLILVTLNATSGVIDDNTAVIELNDGNKGNYLDDAHSISDMRFVLPSYYTESYLRNKISTIENRMKLNASNSDCFVWQTDEHFERSAGYSYGLIRKLCNKLNIPRLFSGGDTAHMGINMDMVKLRRKAFDGKIYQVIGNHEYLSYTFETDGATTEDDIFYGLENYYGNDVVFGNKQRHYYYVNNDVQKIRYVVLNAFAQGDGVTNSATPGYEQEQLNWFSNTALNVDSEWSIIIFTHRLFEGSPIPGTTYMPENCVPVKNIIEAYNGNGKIIAVFQGHTHFDRVLYLSDGAIPVIITTCDNNGLYRYDETLQEYVKDYDVERESGTIREHAFDVVTIDKTLKRISLVRIGCPARDGSEPEGELVEERIVYWQ